MLKQNKPNALIWLLLSIAVIAIDQWSKNWVLTSLPEFTAVPVVDGFWNWYRTYNTGAAFSFLSDAGGWQKYLFTVLAFGISGLLAWWLARTYHLSQIPGTARKVRAVMDWTVGLPFQRDIAEVGTIGQPRPLRADAYERAGTHRA